MNSITANQDARFYSLEEHRVIDLFLHDERKIDLNKIIEQNKKENQSKPFASGARNQNCCKQAKAIYQIYFYIVAGKPNDKMEEDKDNFAGRYGNSKSSYGIPSSSSNPL